MNSSAALDGMRSPSQMVDNVFDPASKDKVWIPTASLDVQAEVNQSKDGVQTLL